MHHEHLSTKKVAQMLHVTETTIKRWADDRLLTCIRTPGGHRKFAVREIVRFAQTHGYTISGWELPDLPRAEAEQVAFGLYSENYEAIAELIKRQAIHADREGLYSLLLYLYKCQRSLPIIFDKIIQPAFHSIGMDWKEGRLEISKEHAASQALLESLVKLTAEFPPARQNGKRVICACLEGEFHEIGLRAIAYSLELDGWSLYYVGSNTPIDTMEKLIMRMNPALVCISVSHGIEIRAVENQLVRLSSICRKHDSSLLVGGSQSLLLNPEVFIDGYVAPSLQEAMLFARKIREN